MRYAIAPIVRAVLAAVALALPLSAQPADEPREPSPHAIEIPKWFADSFLDFTDEVRDAAREGKRVMVYFGQDGCPYCKALMQVDFGDAAIVARTRARFVAIALNMWGDRETRWLDGKARSEKDLARELGVQYTPTLLFLDEKGAVRLRMNGYRPPESFRIALDYAAGDARESFTEFLARRTGGEEAQARSSGAAADLPRLLAQGRPVLVIYEYPGCRDCEAMRRESFARPEVKPLLDRFAVVPLELSGQRKVVAPDGALTDERRWARSLSVAYAPTLVFLDAQGREVFRSEGYLRPFHLASALEYVASGALREEPSFQRYVQKRGEAIRAAGDPTVLW